MTLSIVLMRWKVNDTGRKFAGEDLLSPLSIGGAYAVFRMLGICPESIVVLVMLRNILANNNGPTRTRPATQFVFNTRPIIEKRYLLGTVYHACLLKGSNFKKGDLYICELPVFVEEGGWVYYT